MLFSLFDLDAAPNWLIWAFWISPLMYTQNALSTNEFLGRTWKHVRIPFFEVHFFSWDDSSVICLKFECENQM